jgi:5-methylthioadenosine/S-adenosylhomocysteine deaminase
MSIVSLNQAASGRSLLIRGGSVISMDTRIGDLPRGDVHIRDGVIVDVAQQLDVPDAEIIDASSMVVMPGFVDGHRHLWEGIVRNSLPNGDLGDYMRVIMEGFAPALEPEDAHLGTLVSALGALDAGVTTVLDWSHIQTTPDHTAATIAALRESGIRAVFAFGPPGLTRPRTRVPARRLSAEAGGVRLKRSTSHARASDHIARTRSRRGRPTELRTRPRGRPASHRARRNQRIWSAQPN